ncbi:MAG: hypothetical protein LV477_12840, partial [Candidatus Nitrosotalea sp.]|nr:hypothetical protein [Candidatus Nitrosotalea sp.]
KRGTDTCSKCYRRKNNNDSARRYLVYNKIQILTLFLISSVTFTMAFAETSEPSQTVSLQDQILKPIESVLHFKFEFMLLFDKRHITEYSLIGSIALVIIVVIASSARVKNKSSKPRLG